MKQLFFTLLLIFCTAVTSSANSQPGIVFSQEVIAVNADGSLVTPVIIDPETMIDIQTHDFDLGRKRLLRIHTNLSNAGGSGLNDVVNAVKSCYSYIESATGQQLNRGVMLYLIELDEVPYTYSFRATYDDASQWGEVRLALIAKGTPLSGTHAATSLSDLLYDTLPHELGHDAFDGVPLLLHDTDDGVSNHTRWFIEGVCEVLAKGFSQREVPGRYEYFLNLRNVGTVLAEPQVRENLLSWAQTNNNDMFLESSLYGASMLTMMTWTESITLSELFELMGTHNGPIRGTNLIAIMQKTAGIGPQEMLNRAQAHGESLSKKMVLAQLELE